ncbi:hypothetical protein [Streptomyces sp. NPDC046371]|uniref:hypothetical protein n=1 Tax=Streptomyces sp. NPDC046371 TaxID=3154916 RepID=UPI00340A49BF
MPITLTFSELVAYTNEAQRMLARNAEGIRVRANQMNEIAVETARVAEALSALAVDNASVSETKELAKIMLGLGGSVTDYAASGEATARAAGAAVEQAKRTHSGIQEQFNRAPVDLSNVNRQWLWQE